MPIIGFNFTKMLAEKTQKSKGGKVNISNNIAIKNVEISDETVGTKDQKLIRYEFEFKSTYSPDLGRINLDGEVLMLENEKKVKHLMLTNIAGEINRNLSEKDFLY